MSWLILAGLGCGRLGFDEPPVAGGTDGGALADSQPGNAADAAPAAITVVEQTSFTIDTGTSGPGILVQDMAVDPAGNIYVTGGFNTLTFAGDEVVADGTTDAYIASFDRQFQERWVQDIGAASTSVGLRLFWRGASLYSHIIFSGRLDDAGIDAQSNGQDDQLITRMSADGQVEDWAAFGSVGDDDFGRGLYVLESGQVLTGGACADAFDYGGGPLVGDGSRDPCVALLDENLDHVLSGRILGPGNDAVRGVALFPDGDSLVVGSFSDTLTIDGEQLNSAGGDDVFAVRLRPDGSVVWKDTFGGVDDDRPEHVLIDESGYIYAAVTSHSSVVQHGKAVFELDTADGPDALLLSADSWGTPHWAVVLSGPGSENIEDIALLADGSLAFAGTFQGPATLAGRTVEAAGEDRDALVGVIDPWGEPLWWRAFGSIGADSFEAVAVHPDGGVTAAGFAAGPIDFGTGPLGPDDLNERGIMIRLDLQ